MEIVLFKVSLTSSIVLILFFVWKVIERCWVAPLGAYRKLRRNGLNGPTPMFPLGNIGEMQKTVMSFSQAASSPSKGSRDQSVVTHDIHSFVFPFFAQWQKLHGKVFVYWLGVEPFLYIADPEFLKQMAAGVVGKSWGKPTVFKNDREPMFGNGLVMIEGDEWAHHRHVITPAFSPANLKAMSGFMVESTTKMLDRWAELVNSGECEIDVEREIIVTAGEIIAKSSFGISHEDGKKVFNMLRDMQITLFKSNRFVGVPFNQFMFPKQAAEARKLGKEIDALLTSIITDRKNTASGEIDGKTIPTTCTNQQRDLLGLLLEDDGGRLGKTLSTRELVDECKTFFFGGHETTALAIAWTLLNLADHPEWQEKLRDEIRQVVGDREVDATMLPGLKKMGWVMNEVLRLYSPAPNVQRQAREDIRVHDGVVIPSGTNMWIDVVGMHHDPDLWGADVFEFRPERFRDDHLYGGCKHKMGFLPFGFGGRMCIGRNLMMMEYKIVLTMILSRFSFSISPNYQHSPSLMLSLRPAHGLPLMVHHL
ncbi:hypothetical protein SAY87_027159 [Trapa incisa]|uniref:Cytokinin hydroxylase n=1 Tax=Trapa incisa TaxID=236973 RepID=A0AAN7JM91_9MYRT|nr:hypothetical protein SAY87_027159 [Trapa incisa]